MPNRGKSPAARYIDRLEAELLRSRPLTGARFSPGHALAGAGSGAMLAFWFSMRAVANGPFPWLEIAAGTLLGAAAFAAAGRLMWNRLHHAHYASLCELARANLLERELLLLCFSEELPARYERLRHAAQSYGKTREASWAELRRGSMRDRLHWLVRNYGEVCRIEKLPLSTPGLLRFKRLLLLPLLIPVFAMLLLIGLLIMRQPAPELLVSALFICLGAVMFSSFSFGALLSVAVQVERTALLSVVVELLDTDLAMQSGLAAGE